METPFPFRFAWCQVGRAIDLLQVVVLERDQPVPQWLTDSPLKLEGVVNGDHVYVHPSMGDDGVFLSGWKPPDRWDEVPWWHDVTFASGITLHTEQRDLESVWFPENYPWIRAHPSAFFDNALKGGRVMSLEDLEYLEVTMGGRYKWIWLNRQEIEWLKYAGQKWIPMVLWPYRVSARLVQARWVEHAYPPVEDNYA